MTSVADRLCEMLNDAGVRYVFGIPGGAWVPFMEAMNRRGPEFILVSNEASAGFMADVCARITGRPCACYGTLGPGAVNLAAGVGGALLDRSPLLAFTTEPPDSMLGRKMQMAINHQELFKPVTKWTVRTNAANLETDFHKSLGIALSEPPGPVHIGLPADIHNRKTQIGRSATVSIKTAPVPDEKKLDKALSIFQSAEKPLLAVGLTAARFGLGDLVRKLVEKHGLPVVLTPMAKGLLPENHDWYGGVLFHALSQNLSEIYNQADLVIGLGYDPVELNLEDWAPPVPLLNLDTTSVDVDANQIKTLCDVTGDLGTSLRKLLESPPADFKWNPLGISLIKERMFKKLAPGPGKFGPRSVLQILREILPSNGIMTCDVGAHTHLIGQAWETPASGLQIMTNGWSSMGFGVPSAIAAQICFPDRQVCCVAGDGGFMMTAGEMAAARRLNLPVVFIVLVDRRLSLIKIKQDRQGFNNYGTGLVSNDYLSSGSLFGVKTVKAADAKSFRTILKNAFALRQPVIVQALVDGSEYADLIA